jgi:hypothetical protein
VRLFESAEEKHDRKDAEARFREVIEGLTTSDAQQAMTLVRKLDAEGKLAALGKRERPSRDLGSSDEGGGGP